MTRTPRDLAAQYVTASNGAKVVGRCQNPVRFSWIGSAPQTQPDGVARKTWRWASPLGVE